MRSGSEELFLKKRKEHASPVDDASTAEASPDRVGRGEQGEARRANSTEWWTSFELARLWFKPGVKMTPRLLTQHLAHHDTFVYVHYVTGGTRGDMCGHVITACAEGRWGDFLNLFFNPPADG